VVLVALVLVLVLTLSGVGPGAAAPARERTGPGTVVAQHRATGPSRLAPAGRATVLRYRTTSVAGRVVPATGLLLVPRRTPPRGGWPLVTYAHMTTGSADECAPTRSTRSSTELRRMTQGDAVARRLLRAGVAVARPDYEGLGVPGPHPYLMGESLATATVDLVRAARRFDHRIGRDWVAAGHSEGAVAALFTGRAGLRLPSYVRLRGVVAFTPVTRMDLLIQGLRHLPVAGPGIDGLVALAGLIIGGTSTMDPRLSWLLHHGGLSARAEALLPDLEDRCLVELTRHDSWGGLAPSEIVGRRGEEAVGRLLRVLRGQDVRTLHLRRGMPVRVDAGVLDAVAPLPLTEELVATYRSRGTAVTYRRWPTAGHSQVVEPENAVGPAVRWILARFGQASADTRTAATSRSRNR